MAKVAQKKCHILILEDLQGRRSISLDNPLYSLGRHCSNSIVVYSKHISRQHATLIQKKEELSQESSFFILDGDGKGNQSHNGIFINGKKCLVHELQDGDLINFGGDVNASYHILGTTNLKQPRIETHNCAYEETTNDERIHKIDDSHFQPKQQLSANAIETLNQEDTFLKPSYQDWLTGLSNRILFSEHMAIALANAREKQEQLAVIYLDLEQFKEINNKFGYPVGDRILKEFAQRMNDCLRAGDIVARWGGDEFTILLKQIKHLDDPMRVSQRILNTLKESFVVEKQQAHLKCNIGIALYPQNGEDVAGLIKTAALNLDTNKQQRLNEQRSQSANKPLANSQLSRVENILRKAIEREEFSLYYQPQVNIHTGEIYGMEALLRWHHPKQGTIYPHQFLSWAEKTDLILPISEWVLQSACRQNRAWQIAGLPYLPISVNFSPRQFQQTNLIQMVEGVLAETGLDPHWLEFEITEGAIVQNVKSARQVFHQLSQLGVPIAIDDFGTGYSAIGYLQEFPFHKLKIAQTCVQQLQKMPQKTGIISAAIALGYTFNLRVVAEGVETQQQLDLLRQLQCQEMQGYRFSQPLGGKEATQFLTRHWIVKAQDIMLSSGRLYQ
ncbi:MAG: EAL domain-containing protein [Hydrococcus sp. RU_2_2]|nr:EAL domain-containing protein [Hydrococcus sp. RU_2_2]NJP20841.1 EAL domain-containing protein [Hydrococcus sp. CRU_1_1]